MSRQPLLPKPPVSTLSESLSAALREEWNKRGATDTAAARFPLIAQSFGADEIIAMTETLLSGRLTMASRVKEFENAFAAYVGAPHAVMVNSGSSANLLAMAVLSNPLRQKRFRPGDEVLVPAVCWSTSVWPILQMGLKPVFVDCDPRTLNADLNDVRAKITPRTRGMVAVHILGNACNMPELTAIARKHDWLWIEDTCESLGSQSHGQTLGTFADFGTYSFYFSHHLTTGEGGMVVCKTQEDADLMRSLRAHGWTRELSNRAEVESRHPDVDSRFMFVNVGYNLRPMEIQATMGLVQLAKIETLNAARVQNAKRLIEAFQAHPKWDDQFEFPLASPETHAVWFGFPALLAPRFAARHGAFLNYLTQKGVENRPIVSGNFTRQPGLKLYDVNCKPSDFPGAETVGSRGFFFGLHTTPLSSAQIKELADLCLGFDF